MRILSRASRPPTSGLPSWATIDEEVLRLAAVLEHVHHHGNLDDFSETQSGKLALMATATRRGLLTWNRDVSRYELTGLGRQHLGVRRNPASPPPPPAPASHSQVQLGSPFSPRALIASGACVVLGVAVMAATLRFFDVEPQHPAAVPDKVASRQDNVPARIEIPARPDQGAAPAPASGKTEQPTASAQTQPTTPAQPAPGMTPAGIGYASSQPGSATPQESTQPVFPSEAASEANAPGQPTPNRSETSGPAKAAVVPIPNPDPRRVTATSESTEAPERNAPSEVRAAPEMRRASKSQQAVQHSSRTEAQSYSHENPNANSAHNWASGKTVDVARNGPLVREERTLRDGTVVVRYQYGNGPVHFETRSKTGRARAPRYAFAGEHLIRLGRLDWLR
jgi:hypothetical protein